MTKKIFSLVLCAGLCLGLSMRAWGYVVGFPADGWHPDIGTAGSQEASARYGSNPTQKIAFAQNPSFPPHSSWNWTSGTAYDFEISYDAATGQYTFTMDPNGTAGGPVSVDAETPLAPNTAYEDIGVQLKAYNCGSNPTAEILGLTINGTNYGNFIYNGGDKHYWPFTSEPGDAVTEVMGQIRFTTDCTSSDEGLVASLVVYNAVNLDADLEVTKACDSYSAGIRCVITVTNHGPSAAPNVVVEEQLPEGAAYLEDDCGAGPPDGNNLITWNVGELAVDETATCVVLFKLPPGEYVYNHVTVSSDVTDPDPGNSSDQAEVGYGPIPTLTQCGMIVVVVLLALIAVVAIRRRQTA
jgi:hypothetical protein